jgi:hypothetical protein
MHRFWPRSHTPWTSCRDRHKPTSTPSSLCTFRDFRLHLLRLLSSLMLFSNIIVADLVRKALELGSDMPRTMRSWPTERARSARYHFQSFSILGVAVGMHVFVGDGDLMQVRHILFRKGKIRFGSPKCNALLESVLFCRGV